MGPNEVRVIELPPDRWCEYRALRLAALRSDPIAFGSTYEESIAYPDELWQRRLTNTAGIMLFAERAGLLIGTAAALLGVDGEPEVAQIVGVFVEQVCRRHGAGRLLLDELLVRLAARPEIARVRLDVTETQAPAIALYRSLGFEVVGRRAGKIRRGERSYDELAMERRNR
jgi:ribosomal protein S18 acetylase RimI-like enzyme